MKSVLVLGATGMLGSVVYEQLQNSSLKVYGTSRLQGDYENIYFDPLFRKDLSFLNEYDYVINCIGIIKPFMKANLADSVRINSAFTYELANAHPTVIQICTDCVYSGSAGNYKEDAPHDALDDYGKSKSLGENPNAMLLRTSIIGPERHKFASLVSWAQSQKGCSVNGFTNHLWNGMTTKQFGELCKHIIENNLFKPGLQHLVGDIVDKATLLSYISQRYNLDLRINPIEAGFCNRTLASNHPSELQKFVKPLAEQIKDM